LYHAAARGRVILGKQASRQPETSGGCPYDCNDGVNGIMDVLDYFKVDCRLADQDGLTPLHVAEAYDNEDAIAWLLKALGPEAILTRCNHNSSPFSCAFHAHLMDDEASREGLEHYVESIYALGELKWARPSEALAGMTIEEINDDLAVSSKCWQDYEFWRILSKGAFGVVVCCRDRNTGQPAIVKVQRNEDVMSEPPLLYKLENGVQDVLQEVEIQRDSAHPNVVSVLQTYDDMPGFTFIAMELLGGGDLYAQVVEQDQLARYARHLLLGLEHMHAQRIVHNDIKEGNVLTSKVGASRKVQDMRFWVR